MKQRNILGDKSLDQVLQYKPEKVMEVKNMDFCFFADIDSINPLLFIYVFKYVETLLEVVKNLHFITVLSKNDGRTTGKRLQQT